MPYRGQTISVFILDDSETDREMYRRHLRATDKASFHIVEAETYRQAKTLLTPDKHFDCYLIDYLLPDIDGITFAREIVARSEGHRIPAILMITGQGSEEIAVEALKLGVTDYLTKKSITEGFFIQPLISAIEKSRLREELRQSRAALERSNRELSDFAHTASHDLKAPIRRVASFCDMLKEDAAMRLNEDDKNVIERMMINVARMQALIDGLLAYASVTTESESRQAVDLAEITHDVIDDIQQDLPAASVTFDVGTLPIVQGYPLKIRQVMANLISNAVKYRGDRPLMVNVGARPGEKDTVVWVRDNGMGIAPEYHKDIFGEFKRLHTRDTIEGTGLGLPICRKIIELHGGRIWVESEEGAGAAFFFTLPLYI